MGKFNSYADNLKIERETLCDLDDEKFLEELYILYSELLYSIANNVLYNSEDAHECISEVFLVAIRKINDLKKHPNKGGWLIVTTQNVAMCFNRVYNRKSFKEDSIHNIWEYSNRVNIAFSIEEQFSSKVFADYDNIADSLVENLLNDKEKVMYDMYYRNGMLLSQIAKSLGIKESALKMRKMRMDRKLRAHIRRLCEKDDFWEIMGRGSIGEQA